MNWHKFLYNTLDNGEYRKTCNSRYAKDDDGVMYIMTYDVVSHRRVSTETTHLEVAMTYIMITPIKDDLDVSVGHSKDSINELYLNETLDGDFDMFVDNPGPFLY